MTKEEKKEIIQVLDKIALNLVELKKLIENKDDDYDLNIHSIEAGIEGILELI